MFVASKLLGWFIDPGHLFALLLLLGLLLWLGPARRFGRGLTAFTAVLLLLAAVLPLSALLVRPLENRFPATPPLQQVDGVLVLGGSTETYLTQVRGQPVLHDSGERLASFVALARRYPQARLAFSGGSGRLQPSRLREADVAALYFAAAGLDPERVRFERQSRNTYENARTLKAMLQPGPQERWLLVTSAWHMPRAVGAFRAAGWAVLPYPTDYRTAPEGWSFSFSLLDGLEALQLAMHEWAGLAFYWMTGRTDSLFPGPE